MRGRISLCRGTRSSLSLFLPAAPASAILSWSSAPHSRRGCRGARSQRTIKKSTKNKLRSAYPSPYRAHSSFSRTRGALLLAVPRVATSRACVGANAALFHPLLPSTSAPSLSLSLSFSAARSPRASRRPRGLTAAAASLPSFSRGLFGVGHGEAAYERRGNGEKSERGKNRVCTSRRGPAFVATRVFHLSPFANDSLYQSCSFDMSFANGSPVL